MDIRFFVLNLIFFITFGLLGFNLYSLQVQNGDYYFKRVQARSDYQKELKLRRGDVFFTDRSDNEIPIALNKDYPIVYAVPKEIDDIETTAFELSEIIDKPREEIIERINNPDSLFSLLINKATDDQIKLINSKKPDSVYIGSKQYRYYPLKSLASHVLGFVGLNKDYNEPTGLYGIENQYNEKLSSGDDVFLTIDRNLQTESESILKKIVEKFEATGGTIIIQKPKTGEILAMANVPEFNPNKYSEFSIQNFINPAVSYVYEPGSVFKPLTMAIGIDLDVITPESTYFDKGQITLNGSTIHNWDYKGYGETTMTKVIERSINTGAVYAQQQIGNKNFIDYLYKFGFEEKTDIDLPNEVLGSLANITQKHAREIDFATAAFGQGTAVTPIQMINAYSAVANGGLLMRPYLNKEDGPYIKRRVISEDTSRKVANMMESAVRKAIIGSIPEFKIAGKTGTAQIPDFENGGYSEEYIHTFVGFAPVTAPQFVILIKLDKPNVVLAGQTVVPAFKDLAQFVLNYYRIPPDNLEE
jgi:cell division protein FtsI/penicillin-binding protein 2